MTSRLQVILQELGLEALNEAQEAAMETYLRLLIKWNSRINLTAIRDVETILRRHFAESMQCARLIPHEARTLLDYGSGGGFPGVPCAVCRPELHVTLAESQNRKAAFLRETLRVLGLPNADVHAGRVTALPSNAVFDVVTLRAVDSMRSACGDALARVRIGGWLVVFSTEARASDYFRSLAVTWDSPVPLAGSEHQLIFIGKRIALDECSTWNIPS